MNDDLLSPRDAGKLLSLTSSGTARLAQTGRLPEVRDSAGRRLFRRADVERVAEQRRAAKQERGARSLPASAG